MYVCTSVCMCVYVCIDINALAQGIKSFLASQVWFQAVVGDRTYGTDSPAISSRPATLTIRPHVCMCMYVFIDGWMGGWIILLPLILLLLLLLLLLIIIHTYIHTYIHVSVVEWLAWLTSNCGRIGAIGSSRSNGLRPNK